MNFYTAPSNMAGGYVVYGGYRRQRGAGIMGSVRKYMAPLRNNMAIVGRQAVRGLKSVAQNKTVRNLAKNAALKGAEVLTSVAVDALQGRDIGESFRERGREAALRTLTGEPSNITPTPVRKSRAKKRKQSTTRVVRKLKQKKRSMGPAKQLLQAPAKKRRRKHSSRAARNRLELF